MKHYAEKEGRRRKTKVCKELRHTLNILTRPKFLIYSRKQLNDMCHGKALH